MKKLTLLGAFCCLQFLLHADPVNVNTRALAHFKAHFTNAEGATWVEAGKHQMYCCFQLGTMTARAFYDGRGNWEYTLESYLPSNLDKDMLANLSSRFPGYTVDFVNEILSDGDPVYMINIEDAGHLKIVRAIGDDIEVTESVKKQ